MILLDTNVLVYAINADAPQHPASRAVVQAAIDRSLPGVLFPQVLLEFFAVITNPRRVTRPLDPERAWEQVTMLRANLPVLDLRPATLTILGEFVTTRRSTGRGIFDLFLAAQMHTHDIGTICTYNGSDFDRLPEVTSVTPEAALGSGT